MRLLIVGGLNGQIGAATKIAMDRGAKVTHAVSIEQALDTLRGGSGADLVFCDVTLDIGALVRGLAAERICTPVVACGIGTDARSAVDAIRAGAKKYLPLPPDPELIAAVLAAVADESHQMIFEDEAMEAVITLADQVAPSEASILITGESGTGKEVMARYIHRKSGRADKAFISVNCAAIPEHLLESELFGHEKGAFTGAVKQTLGKVEMAEGGTLFLDEIGDMPAQLQAKLLRFLQDRVIERVGGRQPIPVNVRVVCATNQDLQTLIAEQRFRQDLYYRISAVTVNVPPLRQRGSGVIVLAQEILQRVAAESATKLRGLSDDALAALQSYAWPGNVRELENKLRAAVIMAESQLINAGDLGIAINVTAPAQLNLAEVRLQAERQALIQALALAQDNVSRAAELLGVSRPTLYDLLERCDVRVSTQGES